MRYLLVDCFNSVCLLNELRGLGLKSEIDILPIYMGAFSFLKGKKKRTPRSLCRMVPCKCRTYALSLENNVVRRMVAYTKTR